MDKELVQGNLGEVAKYDVEFKEGKLVAAINAEAAQGMVEAGMVVKLDAGKVLDALAKAIPGTMDDAMIGVVKAALLGK